MVASGGGGGSCEFAAQEVDDRGGDFVVMGFESEVAGLVEFDFGFGVIALERFGARRKEEGIVGSPGGQDGRPTGAEVLLEARIERDVAGVIQEEVELDF